MENLTRDRGRLTLLVLIMIAVVMVAGGVGIFFLYQAAFEQQQVRLVEMVQSQARLIESIANFDSLFINTDFAGDSRSTILSQITEAHKHYPTLSKTGELILASSQGDSIVFLLGHRDSTSSDRTVISLNSPQDEPIRRALRGESGSLVGPDYRGVQVLAAYEPIAIVHWAIVAKLDLWEIREPFARAAMVAAAAALIAILTGAMLFFRVTNPLIERTLASEARTRSIVDSAVDGVITINEAGIIQSFNPAAQRLFQYKEKEVIGRNVKMLMPPQYENEHERSFRDYLSGGEGKLLGLGHEMLGQRSDGSTFPVYLSVGEFNLGSQRFFTGLVHDISEQKETEAALRESERRYETLAASAPVGIFRTDAKGQCIYVNKKWCELSGLSAEAAIGEGWSASLHSEDRTHVLSEWQRAAGEETPFHLEYRFERPDGGVSWVVGQAIAEYDDNENLVGFVGTVTDISEVKLTYEALEEQETQNRAIVETAVDAVITIDSRGIVRTVNSSMTRLFGYGPDEIIGKNVNLLMPSPHHENHDNYIHNYIGSGQRKIIGIGREVTGRRKDGSIFPIRLSVSEFYLGERRMFTGIIQDMTEQKALEQKILQSERLAVIGKMAAKVAHEVRNPLSSISLNAEMLEEEIETCVSENAEEARGLLKSMIGEIDRVAALTDEYLQFSRLPQSVPAEADLHELISEVVELCHAQFGQHGIELERKGGSGELVAIFDRAQLRRVLLNLMRNAVEAMPTGGKLGLETVKNSGSVIIKIADSGVGIPPDMVDNIFSPFFTTKDFGTGLGLAIAQQIISEHQGQITCQSDLGEGTVFRIELPSKLKGRG